MGLAQSYAKGVDGARGSTAAHGEAETGRLGETGLGLGNARTQHRGFGKRLGERRRSGSSGRQGEHGYRRKPHFVVGRIVSRRLAVQL